MKKYLLALSFGWLFLACGEEKTMLYHGADFVYFSPTVKIYAGQTGENWKDTLKKISFMFYPEKTEDTIHYQVKAGGGVSEQDRYFILQVDSTNAERGVHYEMADRYLLPAGKTESSCFVMIRNTPDMKEKEYYLQLSLADGGDFTSNRKEREGVSITKRYIRFTSKLTEPPLWSKRVGGLIGYFSEAKFNLINSLCPITVEQWLQEEENDEFTNYMWGPYVQYVIFHCLQEKEKGHEYAIPDPDPQSTRGYMSFGTHSPLPPSAFYDEIAFPDKPQYAAKNKVQATKP